MRYHGMVVGEADIPGLVIRRRAAIGGRGRLLVHDEGALHVDPDGPGMCDSAVDLGRRGGGPGSRQGSAVIPVAAVVDVGVGVGAVAVNEGLGSGGGGCGGGTSSGGGGGLSRGHGT